MSSEYFPTEKEQECTYGNYKVKLHNVVEHMKDLFLRDLEVTEVSSGKSLQIRHL